MNEAAIRKDFERVMNIPNYVFWSEDHGGYCQEVLRRDETMTPMCVGEAFHAQEKWKVWEKACTSQALTSCDSQAVAILRDALAKVSHSLVAAGNVRPQAWHSDNEKRAFVIMKAMGEEGLEAIARSLLE